MGKEYLLWGACHASTVWKVTSTILSTPYNAHVIKNNITTNAIAAEHIIILSFSAAIPLIS